MSGPGYLSKSLFAAGYTCMISLIAAKSDLKIEGGVDAGRLYWFIEDGRVLIGLNTDANAQVVLRHIPDQWYGESCNTVTAIFFPFPTVPPDTKYWDHIHNFEVGALLPLGPVS